MKLSKLVEAELIRREKRFLALVRFKDGSEAWAHCPNPGSMRGNAIAGSKVRLVDLGADFLEQGRKLRYRWSMVRAPRSKTWVCVDTMLANPIVEEALLEIPGLRQQKWKREVSYHDARFDFGTEAPGKKYFLEVKSVSMAENGLAQFPDSVSVRAQKHLKTLMRAKKEGHRAILFFLVTRADCQTMSAARAIDPTYADLLKKARDAGVEIIARSLVISASSVSVGDKVQVQYV